MEAYQISGSLMPKNKPKKVSLKYLTEINYALSKDLYKAECKIRDQQDRIAVLKDALKRPSVALFSDQQLNILLEFIAQSCQPRDQNLLN